MRALPFFLLAAMTACSPFSGEPQAVTSDGVVVLSQCSDAGLACDTVADGVSRVAVTACVANGVARPRADASVTLTLSAGYWEASSTQGRTISGTLTADGCLRPTFVAAADSLTTRVDAELLGFRASEEIALSPAPLTNIELTPQLPFRMAGPNVLNVRVRSGRGSPTRGTSVALTADANAPVAIYPQTTLVAPDGTASFNILFTQTVQSVSLTATATPPASDAGMAATTTRNVTVFLQP